MWKEFLSLNSRERTGTIVLIILIIILYFIPELPFFDKSEQKFDFNEFKADIAEFQKSLEPKDSAYYQNRLNKYIIARYDTLDLFKFDPNSTTNENWKKLGLTNKQIKTINNYLYRGGKFFEPEDFRRIYGIRQKQYEFLKPYIDIKNQREFENDDKVENQIEIAELFEFDPNTASKEEFLKLGLKDKQISIIKNYLSKGGKFFKPKDFKKIYGISQQEYKKLEPYIKIANFDTTKTNNYNNTKVKENLIIEINSASVEELQNLKNVNNYIANKIVKYREILGGYVNKDQLLEVYGMKEETYNAIIDKITVNSKIVKKININFAEINDLKKHPYLKYTEAKAIVDYKVKNGSYSTINILKEKHIIRISTFNKIKDYITTTY